MRGEIGGGPVIQAEGIHGDAVDLALFEQEFDRLDVETREVHHPTCVGVAEFGGVDLICLTASSSRVQSHKRWLTGGVLAIPYIPLRIASIS